MDDRELHMRLSRIEEEIKRIGGVIDEWFKVMSETMIDRDEQGEEEEEKSIKIRKKEDGIND